MLHIALENGFTQERFSEQRNLVIERRNDFLTSFSAGPPANVPPLRIKLKPNAIPTIVKLRKYSADQRQ